jgi:DNA mismatch repair protein MutL
MAQQLLFPLHVELNAREAAMADEFEREMKQVGFEIRRFGEMSYLIEAVPADMMNEPDEALIKRVIEGLDDPEWSSLSKHHRIASSIACHSAIRAGEHLNQEQMRDIIDRLLATDIPHACPHGRPTFFQITPTELERRFKRT